jgi:hypothetical protein
MVGSRILPTTSGFSPPFFVRNCPNDSILSFHRSTKERTKENLPPLGYSNFWAKVPALKIFLSMPLRRLKQKVTIRKRRRPFGFIQILSELKNLT